MRGEVRMREDERGCERMRMREDERGCERMRMREDEDGEDEDARGGLG